MAGDQGDLEEEAHHATIRDATIGKTSVSLAVLTLAWTNSSYLALSRSRQQKGPSESKQASILEGKETDSGKSDDSSTYADDRSDYYSSTAYDTTRSRSDQEPDSPPLTLQPSSE